MIGLRWLRTKSQTWCGSSIPSAQCFLISFQPFPNSFTPRISARISCRFHRFPHCLVSPLENVYHTLHHARPGGGGGGVQLAAIILSTSHARQGAVTGGTDHGTSVEWMMHLVYTTRQQHEVFVFARRLVVAQSSNTCDANRENCPHTKWKVRPSWKADDCDGRTAFQSRPSYRWSHMIGSVPLVVEQCDNERTIQADQVPQLVHVCIWVRLQLLPSSLLRPAFRAT